MKRRRLPWRQVAVVVAAGSVLALGGITILEQIMGHPLSSPSSSGTSIGDVVRGDLAPAPASNKQDPNAPGGSGSDQDAPSSSPPAKQQPPGQAAAPRPSSSPPAKQQPPAPGGGQGGAPVPTPAPNQP